MEIRIKLCRSPPGTSDLRSVRQATTYQSYTAQNGHEKEAVMAYKEDELKMMVNAIDFNKRIEDRQYRLRLEDKLHRSYEELRNRPPRWIFQQLSFAAFNPELFPNDLIEVAEHISSHAEIDTTSVLLVLFGSISAAMCGRYVVQVDHEWRESGGLYIVEAAESGSRKSYVISTAKAPLDQYFEKLSLEHEVQSAKYKKNNKHLEVFKRKVINLLINNHLKSSSADGIYFGDPNEVLPELQHTIDSLDKNTEATKPKYSTPPQIFLSIASRVSAGEGMSKQGEFACVFEAEGSFFESEIANKSTHPGLYLKSYDMERYDYSSKNVGKISMQKPSMTIVAFVQPDVLMNFYSNKNLKSRGLNARFLPHFASKPSNFIRHRSLPPTPKPGAMIAYNAKITEMLKRNFTQDKNREIWTVSLTPKAYELVKTYEQNTQPYVRSLEYLHMSSFLAKAHGAVVRLALCIHAWNNPKPEQSPITREEVEAAISLMDVIVEHANIAFSPERSQACVDAQEILAWIRRCDWTDIIPVFQAQDAMSAISGLNKKQCHAALDLLEQHDNIRQYFEAGRDRLCVLNPQLVNQNIIQNNRPIGRY